MSESEAARLAEIERYERYGALVGSRLWQVVELARSIFDVDNVSISTIYADQQICHVYLGPLEGALPRRDTFCRTTIENDTVVVSKNAIEDPRFTHLPIVAGDPHVRFYAGAPLVTPSGVRIGALCLLGFEPREFTIRETKILRDLAALAIEHMELVCSNQAAKADTLTDLRNRDFLIEAMDASIDAGRESTAILIDLDGFKKINDSLGHFYGDETLRLVAKKLKLLEDEGRVVARLGGDEFVVFLDGCSDLILAASLARRIVSDLGSGLIGHSQKMTVAASAMAEKKTVGHRS